ncbi:MAG TPA: hypothetical protein VIS74_06945, partial [Chthoniobacterales bacterium]
MNFDSPAFLAPALQIGAGVILLLMGRRLFWIFVGVVGFLVGFQFGTAAFAGSPWIWLLAVAVGLAACLLAIVLQKVAVVLAGAAAGWLLGLRLDGRVNRHQPRGQDKRFGNKPFGERA